MTDWTAIRISELGEDPPTMIPPRVQLPVLPQAAMEFSRRSQNPDVSTAELGVIVESDSGLTGELLRHVNSSAFGLRQKISTPKHAIATLGIRESCLFLLSHAVNRSLQTCKQKLISLRDFGASNLERALFAQEVATLLNANPDLAFSGAMLADFLLPIITDQLYPLYHGFDDQSDGPPQSLVDYEMSALGWNHARAGAAVMVSWGFPDDLSCCVLMHHRGLKILADKSVSGTAAAAVAIASLIPDSINQVPDGLAQLLFLERKWRGFRLMPIAERVDERVREFGLERSSRPSLLQQCQKLAVSAT